ncbi:hypothetical protein PP175_11910 [Aneurinibacillus sp. Ricciae_BoGa-3]|uniref:hypothetical protein n=1 Tax=Aneurinibacillus sp. Ricciae_BoGa-3 TaxID=3022697 RepID=UPI0023427D1B|nr:hypothetical protein [Aneurinibacillus sp. Ricciae_BoGa-3]WCK56550.1 hypothetical protein PP175_11910 [Aneurinibacillus sp. Ricciae_BoGa-3]
MTKQKLGRLIRLLLSIALLAAFIMIQFPAAWADATNLVQMKTSVGFNGQYKWDAKLPIRITLTNNGTKPAAGSLKLVLRNHSSLNATYIKPLTLQGGETRQVIFPITGQFNSTINSSIAEWVVGGGVANKQPLTASGVPADFLAGMLADKSTVSNLLQTQPSIKQGPSTAPVQLSAEDIPTDPSYNSSLDGLLITNKQYSLLNSEQKKWIKQWIAHGGVMVTVDQTSGAAAWKKVNEAFAQGKHTRVPVMENAYQLADIASYIPGIDRPSLPFLILLFIAYILVIGPLLYYVLKKQKRQGWTWTAVPTAAVITALLIFGYGKWQHGSKVLLQSVDILHITNNGSADLESASSFVVPTGGDYTMQIHKAINLFPVNENANSQRDETEGATVTLGQQKSSILFPKTSFWSLHKAFVTDRIDNTGNFYASLITGTSRITGTVRNNTIYTLHDVRLVYGVACQSIPVLAPGAEIQVNLPTDNTNSKQPASDKLSDVAQLLPSSLGTKDSQSLQSRQGRMLNLLYNTESSNTDEHPLLRIFGWTDQHPYALDMAGKAYNGYRLTLVESRIGLPEMGGNK